MTDLELPAIDTAKMYENEAEVGASSIPIRPRGTELAPLVVVGCFRCRTWSHLLSPGVTRFNTRAAEYDEDNVADCTDGEQQHRDRERSVRSNESVNELGNDRLEQCGHTPDWNARELPLRVTSALSPRGDGLSRCRPVSLLPPE